MAIEYPHYQYNKYKSSAPSASSKKPYDRRNARTHDHASTRTVLDDIHAVGDDMDNHVMAVDAPPAVIKAEDMEDAAPVRLSDEQEAIVELVVGKRRNVFFTGSAGTGRL